MDGSDTENAVQGYRARKRYRDRRPASGRAAAHADVPASFKARGKIVAGSASAALGGANIAKTARGRVSRPHGVRAASMRRGPDGAGDETSSGFSAVTSIAVCYCMPPQGTGSRWKTILSLDSRIQLQDDWTGRQQVSERGKLGYLAVNPITGIGIDNFPRAEGTMSDRAKAQAADRSLAGIKWSAAHNSFLEVTSRLVCLGLVVF